MSVSDQPRMASAFSSMHCDTEQYSRVGDISRSEFGSECASTSEGATGLMYFSKNFVMAALAKCTLK
jgi:hypothetical protein